MVKNWSLARCWHISKQSSFLLEVFAVINYLHQIGPFQEHSQFPKSLQPEFKSTSKALPPKAISEWTPLSGGTLWSCQQLNIPDFTKKPLVTIIEIIAYNHTAASLPCWRYVMPMHSRWQLQNFMHAISTITPIITTIITNSYMKIVQLHKSLKCHICLRAYSSVQIDFSRRKKDPAFY